MLTIEQLREAYKSGKKLEINMGTLKDPKWAAVDFKPFFGHEDGAAGYRIKPEPVKVLEPVPPQHRGTNAKGGWKHASKEKCLALATGYFYQENEAPSWYWLFKHESGL